MTRLRSDGYAQYRNLGLTFFVEPRKLVSSPDILPATVQCAAKPYGNTALYARH